MELLQLKYFLESSKNENFAKTAEKFIVPPSSVSASIKRLEKELGCNLFDRKSNSILLNENGKRLQKSIHIIMSELEQVCFDLLSEEKDDTEIKILVRSARAIIIDKIIDFNKKFSTVQFEVSSNLDDTKFDNYDIIVDEEKELYSDFEKFELCTYRIGIRATVDNPLCDKPLKLSQLANQYFISRGDDARLFKILAKACKKAGFTPKVILKTNDTLCYRRCIDEGVGLVPAFRYPNANLKTGKTTFLQISDFDERQTVYVYYKKHEKSKNIENFVKFLRESIT